MNLKTYSKEATAVGTYEIDWTSWLAEVPGRTIATSTFTVPAGITNDADSNTTTKATIQLSGGTWGQSYEIENHIVASNGDEQSASITIKIQYSTAYCTAADLKALAQGMTASATPPASDTLITDLIERVSRLFDLECGVPEGYFNGPLYPTATARTFYGDGTSYLKLPPYIPGTLNTTITVPTGYTAPDFIEKDGYLVQATSDGFLLNNQAVASFTNKGVWTSKWWAGIPITVTAKWGYASTPADVKLAVIEWIINVWRETDPASQRLVNLDGMALRERCPPRVMEVIKRYRMKTAEAVFV